MLKQLPYNPNEKIFSRDQLNVMNLLVHPVWVFDIDAKSMAWANKAALNWWNAENLEALCNRSFDDMSDATRQRLREYQLKFQGGERVEDRWTLYPGGQAKTVNVTCSGIRMNCGSGGMSMMVEGVPLVKEEVDHESLRGVEMLRHLPMAVCQFEIQGKLMYQNPEASKIFGTACVLEKDHTHIKCSGRACHFLNRFVDRQLGERVLKELQSKKDASVEAELFTEHGKRWSSIKLRKSLDPVTGNPVILYSSRDLTDIIEAKQEKENSRKKSEFLAIMAHEIRTPLHQVTGFIDLLGETKLDDEQFAHLKMLKSASSSLISVINDTLDFSKLEEGKMKFELIPFETQSVVQGSMESVRPSMEEKGLNLSMEWDTSVPFKILGDPNRMRQVLLNLLHNALKFTHQGGVVVRVEPLPETDDKGRPMLKFSVADTGIGISDEQKPIIFKKYQQANASVARDYGGTGLGLTICKSLVINLGGSIGVESELGVGSTFWFTLPYEIPSKCFEKNTEEHEPIPVSRPLHVLIVEDIAMNHRLLKNMLGKMGHTSSWAEDGLRAIECLTKESYDVVLMDIQMPTMDGIEATKRLRTMGFTDLPIIGLTASVRRSDFADLGFTDWIGKPVLMKDLKVKLNEYARSHVA